MAEYIFLLLLFLGLAYFYDIKRNTRGYNTWVNICCFLLILLAGLRNHVGGDTFNYIYNFEQCPKLQELSIKQLSMSEISQPLWFLINSVLKTCCDDFIIVQLFHATIVNVLIFRFLKLTTNKVFVALLFVYCIAWWNFNFEIMRESLCVAIYLNSLFELKNKSVLRYILINIPSFLIHYFSFVIIILTLLIYFLDNKKTMIVLGCVAFIALLYEDTFSNLAMKMAIITSGDLSERWESYLYGDIYGVTSLNFFGIAIKIILLLQPVIMLLFYAKRTSRNSLELKLLMMYLLFFVTTAIFPIFSRFSNYLLVVFIVGSVNFLFCSKRVKSLSYFIVLALFVYNLVNGIREFYSPQPWEMNRTYDCRYIPYTSVFESPDLVREREYGRY